MFCSIFVSSLYEVVSKLRTWVTLIGGIQAAGLERKRTRDVTWTGRIGEFSRPIMSPGLTTSLAQGKVDLQCCPLTVTRGTTNKSPQRIRRRCGLWRSRSLREALKYSYWLEQLVDHRQLGNCCSCRAGVRHGDWAFKEASERITWACDVRAFVGSRRPTCSWFVEAFWNGV